MCKDHLYILLLVLSILTGCGVTQPIRPVEKGSTEITASFGGPIIPLGSIAIPVPYLNVGVMHGMTENVTVFGNAHVTSVLFKTVAADGGVAVSMTEEKGIVPEISVNGRGYFFWDAFRGHTARFYPMASVVGSYAAGERSLFYFGADNLYQFSTADLFVSPFVGYSFPVSSVMVLQLESKWMAMNKDTRHGIFEGVASVGGRGNVGVFVGIQWEVK